MCASTIFDPNRLHVHHGHLTLGSSYTCWQNRRVMLSNQTKHSLKAKLFLQQTPDKSLTKPVKQKGRTLTSLTAEEEKNPGPHFSSALSGHKRWRQPVRSHRNPTVTNTRMPQTKLWLRFCTTFTQYNEHPGVVIRWQSCDRDRT